MGDHAGDGVGLIQVAAPYAAGEVKEAGTLVAAMQKQIKQLQAKKNWLYNSQVLKLIRTLESESSPRIDKLGRLAEVREELLAPYVLRRHNEVWEVLFEDLPNEREKVEAVRRRVLGVRK